MNITIEKDQEKKETLTVHYTESEKKKMVELLEFQHSIDYLAEIMPGIMAFEYQYSKTKVDQFGLACPGNQQRIIVGRMCNPDEWSSVAIPYRHGSLEEGLIDGLDNLSERFTGLANRLRMELWDRGPDKESSDAEEDDDSAEVDTPFAVVILDDCRRNRVIEVHTFQNRPQAEGFAYGFNNASNNTVKYVAVMSEITS